jgi:hypothetical protein
LSYVTSAPDVIAVAAADVTGIGSSLSQAHVAAAASTTGVIVAAQDEVSAAIASLFSNYGQQYQALSAQAAAFHAEFAQSLSGAGNAYAVAEAANANPLQTLQQDVMGVINGPTELLFNRPLIGPGSNGAAGTGQAGGAGGI